MSDMKVGDRIRLDSTNDEYTHLKPGALGRVTGVRLEGPYGQIHVQWDNGSKLSLLPGVDRFTVFTENGVEASDD